MRYSVVTLKQYIKGQCTTEDIMHWLGMLGLNPIIFRENDQVFIEIEVPANRGDLLSAIGIIRAISPYGDIEPLYPDRKIEEESQNMLPVEIEYLDDCAFYAGRIIEQVKVGPSPAWLVDKVSAAGFRSINNVVDITNLVLWEFGQPLHAFDLARINEKIIVRRAGNGEQIVTLDGERRDLSSEVLVISDIEKPVAIAGIMGGLNSEVTDKTTDVFIESAFFNPSRVRRSSKFLGLSTDASLRFEKRADPSLIVPALDRCCRLIKEICGGKISILSSAGRRISGKKTVIVNRKKIDSYLGCNIPVNFVVDTMKKLGFRVDLDNETMKIEISEGRNDIEQDVDIIEEIARYLGYDRIPEEMPVASIAFTQSCSEFFRIDTLKDLFVRFGFTEVVNPGLMDENELDFSSLSAVEIVNPLSRNYAYLRTSLIPGILKNFRDNHNRKIERVSFFEIGKIYYKSDSEPAEVPVACLGSMNGEGFYLFKGRVESILHLIGYRDLSQKLVSSEEGISIEFISSAGFVLAGLILPSEKILKRYGLEKQKIFLVEINLKEFVSRGFPDVNYTPVPKILPLTRDLSLIVADTINWQDVENFIRNKIGFLESVEVFDIYKGENIPEGSTGISVTLVFCNPDGKLTREDADEIVKNLIDELSNNFSISIRK